MFILIKILGIVVIAFVVGAIVAAMGKKDAEPED